MCGLAGFLLSGASKGDLWMRSRGKLMADAISHRGPDAGDVWVDPANGIALSHRRLSILEISSAGSQPMRSHCGRYVTVFNGEIYNWQAIRGELEAIGKAPPWRGHSDTEVLLAAVAAWGIKDSLIKFRGMFAIALWDREESRLILARDRIGEKPLYYGRIGRDFVFASELKSLIKFADTKLNVDRAALSLFLRYGYVPAPYSIYTGIKKLLPGTLISINCFNTLEEPEAWWNFDSVAEIGVASHSHMSDGDAISALDECLGNAVAEQMVADVPLGALLSGGIDSSVIVAQMQARSMSPVKTFTIGFMEGEYDEAEHAKSVANHLGTSHTELHVDAKEALGVIPTLPQMYDEPFADASQIPTALVCALTRQYVTVCLSGDAGDELFGGYNRYFWATSLWNKFSYLPTGARNVISSLLSSLPAHAWNNIFHVVDPLLPSRFCVSNPGDKIHKLAEVLSSKTRETLYNKLVSQWRGPLPLHGNWEPKVLMTDYEHWPDLPSFAEQMMAIDTKSYLVDDILVKVDRAAMAASLETRVPFLDERVISFAWKLPLSQKIRNGEGKWLLRQLLYKYVPREMVDRPKQGFGVPLEHWLRGPLREWAEDLLSIESLSSDKLLNPEPIRAMWKLHLDGRNVQYSLWPILMYQAWRKQWS